MREFRFFRENQLKRLTFADLTALGQQAQQSPRLRANSNLHMELTDPIQRLAIAMEPDTLIVPHRHPHTWEVLTALRGRFTVLVFDDARGVRDLLRRCHIPLDNVRFHGILTNRSWIRDYGPTPDRVATSEDPYHANDSLADFMMGHTPFLFFV